MGDTREKTGLPEFSLNIMTSVVEVLCAAGLENSKAVNIGFKITSTLCERYGGRTSYIPRGIVLEAARKASAIYAEFNGSNYRELSEKYEATEVWVRALVKRHGKLAKKPVLLKG